MTKSPTPQRRWTPPAPASTKHRTPIRKSAEKRDIRCLEPIPSSLPQDAPLAPNVPAPGLLPDRVSIAARAGGAQPGAISNALVDSRPKGGRARVGDSASGGKAG